MKKFNIPTIQVIRFDAKDVIATSDVTISMEENQGATRTQGRVDIFGNENGAF